MRFPRQDSSGKGYYKFSELAVMGAKMPLLVQRVDQGETAMHGHDFAEIVLIVEGAATHETPSLRYRLQPGDCFAIPEGLVHKYSGIEGLKLINLMIRHEFLDSLAAAVKEMRGFNALFPSSGGFRRLPPLSKGDMDAALLLIGKIEAELWERGEASEAMLRSLLSELLIRLCRFAAAQDGAPMRRRPEIGRLADYMESHIRRPASVALMARAGGVSSRTLMRRFKAQTGFSPMSYLNRMRISKACRLLRETEMDVKMVALECGFDDSNYFSRQFKKSAGVSPSQFRDFSGAGI